jgi:hypothetical protein
MNKKTVGLNLAVFFLHRYYLPYPDTPQQHGFIKSANFTLKARQRIGRRILLKKLDHILVIVDRLGEYHFTAYGKIWQARGDIDCGTEVIQPVIQINNDAGSLMNPNFER